MASSPPKRRKTSPTTSVPTTPTRYAFAVDAGQVPQTAPGLGAARASFLSPTKASLARFNPGLLPRPKEVGGDANQVQEDSIQSGVSNHWLLPVPENGINGIEIEATTNGNGADSGPTTPVRDTVEGQTEERAITPVAAAATSPSRTTRSTAGQGLRASPRRRSRTPAAPLSPSKQPQQALAPITEAMVQAVDGSGEAQPSQPEQQVETDSTEQLKEDLRPRAQVDGADSDPEVEEPVLPPMQSQRGLGDPIVTTTSESLLNTASNRPKRSKALAEAIISSPLKTRRAISPAKVPPPTSAVPQPSKPDRRPEIAKAVGKRRREARGPSPEEVDDDEGEPSPKRRLKESLRAQMRRLKDQIALQEAEIERTRRKQEDESPPPIDPARKGDMDRLISQLLTSNDSHLAPNKPQVKLSAIKAMKSFLPFCRCKHIPTLPTPLPEGPIPTYHPITLADPLPHLKVFTPLAFTSATTLLPPTPSGDLLQQHTITAISPHQLLGANLALTVNTTSLSAVSLSLNTLSPWADPELGSWIRQRCVRGGFEPNHIPSVTYALGSYWEMAHKRARCWWRCERAFGWLLGISGAKVPQLPPPQRKPQKKKGERLQQEDDQPLADEEQWGEPTRKDLARFLGQTGLRFRPPPTHSEDGGPEFLVEWKIGFDWTGEAESKVDGVVGWPEAWTEADERGSLGKLGETFELLVKERGVFGAVGGVVGLLLSSE